MKGKVEFLMDKYNHEAIKTLYNARIVGGVSSILVLLPILLSEVGSFTGISEALKDMSIFKDVLIAVIFYMVCVVIMILAIIIGVFAGMFTFGMFLTISRIWV